MKKLTLSKRLYHLRSKTIRWFVAYLPIIGAGIDVAKENMVVLQDSLGSSSYFGISVAVGAIAYAIRMKTTGPLNQYKPNDS